MFEGILRGWIPGLFTDTYLPCPSPGVSSFLTFQLAFCVDGVEYLEFVDLARR